MTSTETTDTRSDETKYRHGFHGIPNPKIRASMSPEDLAIELSKRKEGSPPYILLSHELNIRVAKEQAKLNHQTAKTAGAFTILGAVIGAAATAFFSSQPAQPIVHCHPAENPAATCAGSPSVVINNQPAVSPSVAVGIKAPAPPKGKQSGGANGK